MPDVIELEKDDGAEEGELVQAPDAAPDVPKAAAPPVPTWRGKITSEERNANVEMILKQVRALPSYDPSKDVGLLAQAHKLENDKYNNASTKEEYTDRIKRRLAKIAGEASSSGTPSPAPVPKKVPKPKPPTSMPPPPAKKPAPAPHPAKAPGSGATGGGNAVIEAAWKTTDARGVVSTGKTMRAGNPVFDAAFNKVVTSGCITWAKSMLCNPSGAFMRPGRKISPIERLARISLLPIVTSTKHLIQGTYRPLILAQMDSGGANLPDNTLVVFMYNDGHVPTDHVVFEYEGPTNIDNGMAVIDQLLHVDVAHAARMHYHIGPMLWSATKCFDNFKYKDLPTDIPKSFRRFLVVVLPLADSGVEKDFFELASKNPDSDTNALNIKITKRVEQGDSFQFDDDSSAKGQSRLIKRSDFYSGMMALARNSSGTYRDKTKKPGDDIIMALDRGRVTQPVQPAANDDSDEEEMIVAPKPSKEKKRPRELGHESVGGYQKATDGEEHVESGSDESEEEAEDRVVTKKQRAYKSVDKPKPQADSGDEGHGEEDDDDEEEGEGTAEESEEEELSDVDEEDDDEEEDEEDEEDAMEVDAAAHASGSIGDPEPKKKLKAAVAPPASKAPKAPKAAPPTATAPTAVAPKPSKKTVAPDPAAAPSSATEASEPSGHARRLADALKVAEKASKNGHYEMCVAVKAAGYSSFMPEITTWWVETIGEPPVPDSSATVVSADTGPFTREQHDSVYNSSGGGRDHAATERRRLAVLFKGTRDNFYDKCGLTIDDESEIHPGLESNPRAIRAAMQASNNAEWDMTALALDGEKQRYNRATESLITYNKSLSVLVYGLANTIQRMGSGKTPSQASSSSAPTSGIQKTVSATATNLIKFTPQVAELSSALAKVSGDFNSLVAALNANSALIAEGMEEAFQAAQSSRK